MWSICVKKLKPNVQKNPLLYLVVFYISFLVFLIYYDKYFLILSFIVVMKNLTQKEFLITDLD